MKIFQYNTITKFDLHGISVAMGNFDGLHLGHKAVIEMARPKDVKKKFGVVTFEPHPREFFNSKTQSFRLMNKSSKTLELSELGLDVLIEIPFNKELSLLDPKTFVSEVLCNYFKFKHIVVGEDFKFGYQRQGNAKILKELGAVFGCNVTIAKLIKSDDLEISSTKIRKALSDGRPENAAKMLGKYYSIAGKVLHGEKRGRTLGFPTLNLALDELHLPKFGVYSSVVEIITGKYSGVYNAVVSLGERPTYGRRNPNLEAHLINFSGDLYGEHVSVSLINFQRPELYFENSQRLIEQMKLDCKIAQKNLWELRNHEK